jgi:integrase
MATAKKTPSGMWKVRVYSHTTPDGKKHYRAFTAPTKQEAEQMASKFSGSADRATRIDLTVAEAISGYIRAKEGVLSPSTIRGYRRMERNNYGDIAREKIRRLTTERVQLWISTLAKTMSAKSVKNIHGLLVSAIAFYMPGKNFKVKLPTRAKRPDTAPTDEQVLMLYNAAPSWLKICIGLAAFCGLRRGEVSALKYGDIKDGMIHVHADMVQDAAGVYRYKNMPKTADSIRYVPAPAELLDLIGSGAPDAFILDKYTGSITARFEALRDDLGMTDIRFHDLRAYYASTGAVLIPDTYLARFGGWSKSSGVMKEVYQRELTDRSQVYADMMTGHFSALILKSMT